jgi:hypothetical protein
VVKIRIAVTSLIVVLSTCSAATFAGEAGKMKVYETPEYTLVAVDTPQLRRHMPELPRLVRTMEIALDVKSQPNPVPTYIYVVSNTIWDKYLAPSNMIYSEFVPTRFTNYILANALTFDRGQMFHQYSHLFLRTQMIGAYPLWFDEGLALVMSRAQYLPSNAVEFRATREEVEGGWIATDRLFRANKDSPEYLNQAEHGSFMFQSRIMVHRGLIADPEFGKQVFAYLLALNNFQSIENAAQAGFHNSLADVDFLMRAYAGKSSRGYAKIETGPIAEVPLGAGRELPELDALQSLVNMMLDTGYGAKRVHELLEATERASPGNLRTALLRLRMSAQRADDAALENQLSGLEGKLSAAQHARLAGLALFDRFVFQDATSAITDPKLANFRERSFALLNASLEVQPKDPEAAWAYANLAAGMGRDLDNALLRLAAGIELLPRNADLAHAAALVFEARHQEKEMIPFLRATARYAHTFEEKLWAKERLERLQAETASTSRP